MAEEFIPGVLYDEDSLPENVMNNSGKLEYVDDNVLALALDDGRFIEFKQTHVMCTGVGRVEDDGSVTELKGELN